MGKRGRQSFADWYTNFAHVSGSFWRNWRYFRLSRTSIPFAYASSSLKIRLDVVTVKHRPSAIPMREDIYFKKILFFDKDPCTCTPWNNQNWFRSPMARHKCVRNARGFGREWFYMHRKPPRVFGRLLWWHSRTKKYWR